MSKSFDQLKNKLFTLGGKGLIRSGRKMNTNNVFREQHVFFSAYLPQKISERESWTTVPAPRRGTGRDGGRAVAWPTDRDEGKAVTEGGVSCPDRWLAGWWQPHSDLKRHSIAKENLCGMLFIWMIFFPETPYCSQGWVFWTTSVNR